MIFDSHCDSLSCPWTEQISLNQRAEGRQFDFAQAVGVTDFQVMAIYVEGGETRETIDYADFGCLERRLKQALQQNDQVQLITAGSTLRQWQKGPLGVILSLEGGEVIGTHLARLEEMYDLGLRAMSLTWNDTNALASGCGAREDEGLSTLGREAVRLMNRLGINCPAGNGSSHGA